MRTVKVDYLESSLGGECVRGLTTQIALNEMIGILRGVEGLLEVNPNGEVFLCNRIRAGVVEIVKSKMLSTERVDVYIVLIQFELTKVLAQIGMSNKEAAEGFNAIPYTEGAIDSAWWAPTDNADRLKYVKHLILKLEKEVEDENCRD